MDTSVLVIAVVALGFVAYAIGRSRSIAIAQNIGGIRFLNSLPFYYGTLTALWCAVPSIIVLAVWTLFDDTIIRHLIISNLPAEALPELKNHSGLLMNQIYNVAAQAAGSDEAPAYMVTAAEHLNHLQSISRWALTALIATVAVLGTVYVWLTIQPQLKARFKVEKVFRAFLFLCSSLAVLTTIGIIVSVAFESLRFFAKVPFFDFLLGLEWSPQMAIRDDQQGSSGSFGAVPLFIGTALIAGIALLVSVPCGLMSAIYLSEYASRGMRDTIKPMLEILAGIPTVVYGFFAALTVAPIIRDLGLNLGLDNWMVISSESALAAGLVMGVMIIPFVSSLSDDVINAVPQSMRDGALGLGSTKSEVVRNVVIPAALPGIVGGVLLAASRAIGETMIVVMAAGMAANLTLNPLDSVTTVTVQIVTLLVGDQEFDSPKTLAAFALGLVLFVVTLCLNYFALHIVRKYREQYE
ncbi:MAG: phosphate ABC transporter permease subunit PstC [Marinagarivorans sp.]|nr:phosphate ABC transporter permease subunit PstC [Marinagarivorans sp.]